MLKWTVAVAAAERRVSRLSVMETICAEPLAVRWGRWVSEGLICEGVMGTEVGTGLGASASMEHGGSCVMGGCTIGVWSIGKGAVVENKRVW